MWSHLPPFLDADVQIPQRTHFCTFNVKPSSPANECWRSSASRALEPRTQGQVHTRQLLARSWWHHSLQRSLLNRNILPSKNHTDEKLHLCEGKHSLTQLTTFQFEVLFVTTKHYSPHQGVVFLPGIALCFNRVWMPETLRCSNNVIRVWLLVGKHKSCHMNFSTWRWYQHVYYFKRWRICLCDLTQLNSQKQWHLLHWEE